MKKRFERARAGFTLAELMVVIVIIGLLATLVVPNVVKRLFVANKTKAKADIVALSQAVDEYAIQNGGRYPDTLDVLVTPDQDGFTYLKSDVLPKDPWGHEYFYERGGTGAHQYRIGSYGKDGAPGGDSDDKDLDNIMIQNGEI